jgi:hypothetical protein
MRRRDGTVKPRPQFGDEASPPVGGGVLSSKPPFDNERLLHDAAVAMRNRGGVN